MVAQAALYRVHVVEYQTRRTPGSHYSLSKRTRHSLQPLPLHLPLILSSRPLPLFPSLPLHSSIFDGESQVTALSQSVRGCMFPPAGGETQTPRDAFEESSSLSVSKAARAANKGSLSAR